MAEDASQRQGFKAQTHCTPSRLHMKRGTVLRVHMLSSSVEGADAQSWINVVVFNLTRVLVHTVLQLLLRSCARPCLPGHVREGRLGAIADVSAQILESRRPKITFIGPPLSYSRSSFVVRAQPLCKNVDFILWLSLLLLMPLHSGRDRSVTSLIP